MRQALLANAETLESASLSLAIRKAAASPTSVRAYVEVHIEQGPVLEELGLPLGVVSAIAGQSFLVVSLRGVQGHAGTVPMSHRRDSLAAAAEVLLAIEKHCQGMSPSLA